MNYGTTKILPITGGGVLFAGAMSFRQTIAIAIVAGLLTTIALITLRKGWRRGKSVTER